MAKAPLNNDDAILDALLQNDEAGLTLMLNVHYNAVYNCIRRVMKNEEDAKDLALELFEIIWEKRHSLKLRKPLRNYLLIAGYNRALNYLRNKSREARFISDFRYQLEQKQTAPSAAALIEGNELKALVKKAMATLPKRALTTFILSRKMGMSKREMAARLGVTEKAIEMNMTRALKKLRQVLIDHVGKK